MIKALHAQGMMQQQEIVFILLGIHTRQADRETFQQLGVQEFTSKPLSKETVMDAYHKYWRGDTAQDHTHS